MQSSFIGRIKGATELLDNDNKGKGEEEDIKNNVHVCMCMNILCILGIAGLYSRANKQLTEAIEKRDLSLITTALYNMTALLITCKG